LTDGDREVINYFSGSSQQVEKTDLFTGEKRILAKVFWPNVKIAAKAAQRFSQSWENEIDFVKSYVYDKGLVFGAMYDSANLKSLVDDTTETKDKFAKTFGETKESDSLKYKQLAYWFNLLEQPIPSLGAQVFGDAKFEIGQLHDAWVLARIANIPLNEALHSRHVSEWLKSALYTYLRKNNVLVPTSEELKKGKATHRVTGALTIAPTAGTYFNTVVCDFESLYPSCIDSFNLSYETVDCQHPECRSNKIPDVDYHVCTKRRGFYAVLVGALKELRIKLFKPMSKDSSLSETERRNAAATAKLLKLISVSSYGVTVRIHGLACPPLAESITGYGRYVLRESWNLAEGNGLRPLYGDTDSLFLDNASNEQVDRLIRDVKERFRLDLAVEKRYSLCVLPKAKKAYFGILADGSPDIKGVTPIKSNSPSYITNVFQQCIRELSTVKNEEEYSCAKEKMRQIVRNAVAELKKRQVKLADLVYSVRLYFDPNEKVENAKTYAQPYQCALQLIDMGKKLNRGDTVSFIKVKPFKYKEKTFTVKPQELVSNLTDINVGDYVRNLLTALNQTFEPMGIRIEEEKKTDISKWLTT
jgi:DNA polymerase I